MTRRTPTGADLCKHVWRFREKRRTTDGWGYGYTAVTYYCEKCLKTRTVAE